MTFDSDYEYNRMFVFGLFNEGKIKSLPLLSHNLRKLKEFMERKREIERCNLKIVGLEQSEPILRPNDTQKKELQYTAELNKLKAEQFKFLKQEDKLTIEFIGNVLDSIENYLLSLVKLNKKAVEYFGYCEVDLFRSQLFENLYSSEDADIHPQMRTLYLEPLSVSKALPSLIEGDYGIKSELMNGGEKCKPLISQ